MSEAQSPKKPKKSAPKKADHPTYKAMVSAALTAMKDRKGSSKQAIEKHIRANYSLGGTDNGIKASLKRTLKKMVDDGLLIQTSGKGASGSFKLKAKEVKKPKKVTKPKTPKKAKKPAAKKPSSAKKAKTVKKKPSAKKPAAKKPAAKKAAKKPAAKKAVKKPVKKTAAKKKPAAKTTKKAKK